MDILVDYLTFTFPYDDLNKWCDDCGLIGIAYELGKSRYGWSEHNYYNGIHLYLGDRIDACIELSGIGCRTLETLNNNSFDWLSLFRALVDDEAAHVSRLDIACDDRECLLNFSELFDYTSSRKYISRARHCTWTNGDEQIVYYGSSQSDTRLRIYNKAMERGVHEHWIRAEFQFRNDAALSFLLNLLHYGDIGVTYSGVLINYLRYTVSSPDDNRNNGRLLTAPFWEEFTRSSNRIKNIKVGGLEYNYSSLTAFLEKGCASSIKTFLAITGGDIGKLLDMVNKAVLSKKQKSLIEQLRVCGE